MEGWARFEQRARERRIEKRLAAAQAALTARRFAECRAALAELNELNPAHPDLQRLTLQLARAETRHRPRLGAFAVSAAAFAVVVLAASWVGNSKLLQSSPPVETAAPAPVAETRLAARDIVVEVPAAIGSRPETVLSDIVGPETPAASPIAAETSTELTAPVLTPPVPTPPVPAPAVGRFEPLVPAPAALPTELYLPASTAIGATVILPTPSPQRVAPPPPAAAPAASRPVEGAPAAPVVDDAARVRSVVERYQAAYERLDASLVHDVWPGVNEAALARAFDGLESQTLTFRACDVQLRGAVATVLCTGSTRYVPKIGSREPHVDPLTWTFTLRKRANDEWQIETARAER
jgi:hypothetical protein